MGRKRVTNDCKHCQKVFKRKKDMNYHIENGVCMPKVVHNNNFCLQTSILKRTCQNCNAEFKRKIDLTNHIMKRLCAPKKVKKVFFMSPPVSSFILSTAQNIFWKTLEIYLEH